MSPPPKGSLEDGGLFEIDQKPFEAGLARVKNSRQLHESAPESTAPRCRLGCCPSPQAQFDVDYDHNRSRYNGAPARDGQAVSIPSKECLSADVEGRASNDFIISSYTDPEGDVVFRLGMSTSEASLPRHRESCHVEASPGENSALKSASGFRFLALPPELRNMVYQYLILDLVDSYQNAALRFAHNSVASMKQPLTAFGYALPITKDYLPARPSILAAHPILRNEFGTMYRSTLLPIWTHHADLFQAKAAQYLKLYASGFFETGAKEELLYMAEFGHDLADFLVRELCCVGLSQLSYGERFMCSQAKSLWKSHRNLGKSGRGSNPLPAHRRAVDVDVNESWVEKIQSRIKFASSFIESIMFRPKVGLVGKEDKYGIGFKSER